MQVRTALGAATVLYIYNTIRVVKFVKAVREAKPRAAHRRPKSGMMVLKVARVAMPRAALGHRSDSMMNATAKLRRFAGNWRGY